MEGGEGGGGGSEGGGKITWQATTSGAHGVGSIWPTSNRMGFGDWQAIWSGVGFARKCDIYSRSTFVQNRSSSFSFIFSFIFSLFFPFLSLLFFFVGVESNYLNTGKRYIIPERISISVVVALSKVECTGSISCSCRSFRTKTKIIKNKNNQK